jgi:tryptophan-rich sensory protein
MPSRHEWLALAGFVGLCFAVAGIGSGLTTPALDDWYALLRKPAWTPPNWLFGPVWSALYLSMAVAAWLVWRRRREVDVRVPLSFFLLQLALNVIWSGLFFALQRPQAAFFEIVVLWVMILITLVCFWRVSVYAGWLFIPYLAWVTFAAALNFSLWRLNN